MPNSDEYMELELDCCMPVAHRLIIMGESRGVGRLFFKGGSVYIKC